MLDASAPTAPRGGLSAGRAAADRRYLLVFDGSCGFCRWTLDRLRELVPVVPPAVDGRAADLSALGLEDDDVEYSSWLLEIDEASGTAVHYGGIEGLAELLRRQPSWPHRLLGNLMVIPGVKLAGHEAYDLVARNRHRLPHGTAACELR